MGDAPVRALVADRADDRRLRVAPGGDRDPGRLAQGGSASLGGDRQARGYPPTIVEPGQDPGHRAVERGDGRRRDQPQAVAVSGGGGVQRHARMAVLDDMAERRVADLAVIVVQEKWRIAVRDTDFLDRLGKGFEPPPHADALQHPA